MRKSEYSLKMDGFQMYLKNRRISKRKKGAFDLAFFALSALLKCFHQASHLPALFQLFSPSLLPSLNHNPPLSHMVMKWRSFFRMLSHVSDLWEVCAMKRPFLASQLILPSASQRAQYCFLLSLLCFYALSLAFTQDNTTFHSCNFLADLCSL